MIYLLLLTLGLAVGSFLNVLIDRLPEGEDIVFTRSHCDHCRKTIKIYDLFPLISYINLAGRCRHCRRQIPLQNPLVEMATALIFLFVYQINLSMPVFSLWTVIFQLTIISILLAILVIDLKHSIIPDSLLIFLIILTFIFQLVFQPMNIVTNLTAGFFYAAFFLALVLITRGRGMGLGDVKFAFFIGLLLGPKSTLVSFYLAFLTGSIISLILVIEGKKRMKSTIPFAPFLVVSTVVSLYWGLEIFKYFTSNFL